MKLDLRQYRKRGTQILVEAVKLTADNAAEIANWSQSQMVIEEDPITNESLDALNVWTQNGEHRFARCSRGQYVVKYGENFYVASPSTFDSLYETVG